MKDVHRFGGQLSTRGPAGDPVRAFGELEYEVADGTEPLAHERMRELVLASLSAALGPQLPYALPLEGEALVEVGKNLDRELAAALPPGITATLGMLTLA